MYKKISEEAKKRNEAAPTPVSPKSPNDLFVDNTFSLFTTVNTKEKLSQLHQTVAATTGLHDQIKSLSKP